ncbi:prolipoprotein diacylglyceryl transferase [Reinekea forsetii]|uniref:Phosphatidylglycerol--prolipoprotein diacylglyceryl transferase n=2 Tax=Reinekea forsetii TaxID=1336806 RepID=A0A2K8KK30_9GAMM|nr:prolipoprotein diacylglyceryl transferase [Reinekea forsetii]
MYMVHPQFDPVAFSLGPLSVHWYGIMYLLGFLVGQYLGIWRAGRDAWRNFSTEEVKDLLFYIVVGIIIGGRVGYVFFYHFDLFIQNPLYLVKINQGGMSFHGGFLGVAAAVILFARKTGKAIFSVGDFVAPLVAPGILFGRFGNFLNGELWGRPTDVPWAMIFPQAGDAIARHPSQLYQMAGEGFLLLVLLWWWSAQPRPRMAVSAMFMIGYGVLRTAAEFFRQPDQHIGYLMGGYLTQGMLLSVPLILVGGAMMVFAYRHPVFDVLLPEGKKASAGQKSSKRKTRAKTK